MRHRTLALLAALLVVPLTAACDDDEAAPARTQTPTPPAVPSDRGPVLDAAALTTGRPPRVPYAFSEHPTFGGGDWTLVRTDGSSVPFGHRPALFVAFEDRVVNGYGTEGGFVVEVWDRSGERLAEIDGLCHFALVTTPSRDRAAWLEGDTLAEVAEDGSLSTRPVVLPDGHCGEVDPVGLRDASLYVDGRQAAPSVVTGPGEPVPIAGLRDLEDVSARGNLAGRLPDEDHCWAVLRPDGRQRWRTCADRLVSFSPDGRHLLGTVGQLDPRRLVVHGPRNGRFEAQWDNVARQWLEQVEWEDAGHLLAVVRNPAVGWAVVRLGIDGRAEYAVPPVRTGSELSPFRLPLS